MTVYLCSTNPQRVADDWFPHSCTARQQAFFTLILTQGTVFEVDICCFIRDNNMDGNRNYRMPSLIEIITRDNFLSMYKILNCPPSRTVPEDGMQKPIED